MHPLIHFFLTHELSFFPRLANSSFCPYTKEKKNTFFFKISNTCFFVFFLTFDNVLVRSGDCGCHKSSVNSVSSSSSQPEFLVLR